jgi:hypothetical protein
MPRAPTVSSTSGSAQFQLIQSPVGENDTGCCGWFSPCLRLRALLLQLLLVLAAMYAMDIDGDDDFIFVFACSMTDLPRGKMESTTKAAGIEAARCLANSLVVSLQAQAPPSSCSFLPTSWCINESWTAATRSGMAR